MSLQDELEQIRPEIRTDGYSMSIGEWINLYRDNEIDIHPEFQRFFRWSDSQKSRFIESILLGIPIPTIFVAQRDDGVWDVIDGLQRLSTIYQLAGILRDEEGELVEPLVLHRTRYLPSLENKRWNDPDDPDNSLKSDERRYIKRAKFNVGIIQRESDEFAIFELFQRLNTGGSQLSNQEIRNCILVQANRDLFAWMRELANYDSFKECTVLTDRAIDEQYDLELVLRFLVFRTMGEDELQNIGDLGEFLTDQMYKMAKSEEFDQQREEEAFKVTFDILARESREDSFRRYDSVKDKFMGGFLVSAFEVFALGIGYNYRRVGEATVRVRSKIEAFWRNDDYSELDAGSGVRASTRIPSTILHGREMFDV